MSSTHLSPALRKKIAVAVKYAYCPAALTYLEPVTYGWHANPKIRSRRRDRAIAERKLAVDQIRYFFRADKWPPPYPGDWGPKPQDLLAFPGQVFTPAEWVKDPEDPDHPSPSQEFTQHLAEDSDTTEQASDVDDPPEQRVSKYESKKSLRKSQDSWYTNPNSFQLKKSRKNYESKQSLRESQDSWKTNPNSFQPKADSSLLSFESNPFQTQSDDSQPLPDAQDTRHSLLHPVQPEEDLSHLTFETNPFETEANSSQGSYKTTSTLLLPDDRPHQLVCGGGERVSRLHLFYTNIKHFFCKILHRRKHRSTVLPSIEVSVVNPCPESPAKPFLRQKLTGWEFNQVGRLVRDDARFNMDDAATQKATNLPNGLREGREDLQNLSKLDRSNIVCILSPMSPAAYKAVELVAATSPQHILQQSWLAEHPSYFDDYTGQDDQRPGKGVKQPDGMDTTQDEDTSPGKPSLDIALRLTSKLLYPWLGFIFGRASDKCDMLICTRKHQTMRVSGAHFRIYVNEQGILMCRDTSTNGTWVDGKPLEQKPQAKSFGAQMTLHHASMIELMLRDHTETMRFHVNVPERAGESKVYGDKLDRYLSHVAQLGRQNQEAFNAKAKGLPIGPPAPMPSFDQVNRSGERSAKANKNLVAGTERYNHGMHWDGDQTFKICERIGTGAFASVYKLVRRRDGCLFAAKEIPMSAYAKKGVMDRKVDQELKIMRRLQHPNIVQYVEHYEKVEHLYILMELVQYGDLGSQLKDQPRLPEYFCQAVASQMCQALKYLHDNDITHRDLKPDNILIASNNPSIFKLSDFGLSKVVADDETFLQTFCGTLLYCAPEVYPAYDRYERARNRKRLRANDGSPIKQQAKQRYTSAVDTWGLAAVLYHLLCGQPPITGTSLSHRDQMLHAIMTTSVDYTRLRLSGVSEDAVDFVKRSLVTNAAARPSDGDCLAHAWITQKKRHQDSQVGHQEAFPEVQYNTRDTERAPEEELNAFASQLSIADRHYGRDDVLGEGIPSEELELEEIQEMGQSKRKGEYRDEFEEEASISEYNDDLASFNSPLEPLQQQPKRLFGEVTPSALRSSGTLGWQARAALEVASQGQRDLNVSESHYEGTSQFSITDYLKPRNEPTTSHSPPPPPQLNFDSAAPSLLGTEAMVGQMKMDSEMADPSLPSTQGQVTSPEVEETRVRIPQIGADGNQSNTSSQGLYSATPPPSPKPNLPTASTHEPTGSKKEPKKRDADQIESRTSKRNKSSAEESATVTTHPEPEAGNTVTAADPNQHAIIQQAASFNPQTQPSNTPSSSTTKASDTSPVTTTAPVTITASHPSISLPPPATPSFGTLTTLPNSIHYPTINLTKRVTTFGRNPIADHKWLDIYDIRVPKEAFGIVFWRPSIENVLAHNPNLNWAAFNDISALITTRTSKWILINDVKLEQGKDCWLYGHLKTGDVITVFDPVEGAKTTTTTTGKESECLKFYVDIKIGKSKELRMEGEVFKVVEEKVVYEKKMAEIKSRQASMRASQEALAVAAGNGKATSGYAVAGAEEGDSTVAAPADPSASAGTSMPAPEQ